MPELPHELAYIWEWFKKLSRKRQSGMGPCPITSEEIRDWCALRRVAFEPYEHDILDQLDDLYLHHQYTKKET